VDPPALAGHRCAAVRHASGAVSSWHFKGAKGTATEFTPQAQITANDPEAMIDLALAGGGIVQSGLHHALPYLRSGRLQLLLADLHDAGTREIVVHYPHRQYLAPRVRVVVDTLLAHFADSADLHITVPQARALFKPDGGGTPGSPDRKPPAQKRSPRR
jgi:DNA-binding transcriptional LysR family regulator